MAKGRKVGEDLEGNKSAFAERSLYADWWAPT